MRYSRRFTDFRRSPLYRELKRRDGHRAVSVYQNLVDTLCEKYKAGQGNSFTLTMPEQDWLREVDLHHNARVTLRLVLELASSNGAVVYELLEGKLSINIPNIVEFADEYAKRMERNSGDTPAQKEKIKEEKNLSSFSDEDGGGLLQKVRSILSKNVGVAFVELPPVIETFFEQSGECADVFNKVVGLIATQFEGGNAKQRQKGLQLVERVKAAYQSGLKSHEDERIVLTETSSARSTRMSQEQEKRAKTLLRLTTSDPETNEPPQRTLKRKLPGHINGAVK